jgi:hypothetical protein
MHLEKLRFGLGQDLTIIDSLNLYMYYGEDRVSERKMAEELLKDIKVYHINFWS